VLVKKLFSVCAASCGCKFTTIL